MRNLLLRVFFIIIIGFTLLGSQAGAVDQRVDRNKGQTIDKALATAEGTAGEPAILVTGTCEEFVTISRDRVSIASEYGASIVGQIRIFGPVNVVLRDIAMMALVNDSGAIFGAETSVPPNNSGRAVLCAGEESSFEIHPPAVVGPTACPYPGF